MRASRTVLPFAFKTAGRCTATPLKSRLPSMYTPSSHACTFCLRNGLGNPRWMEAIVNRLAALAGCNCKPYSYVRASAHAARGVVTPSGPCPVRFAGPMDRSTRERGREGGREGAFDRSPCPHVFSRMAIMTPFCLLLMRLCICMGQDDLDTGTVCMLKPPS
jgi:hypothetical protein